MTWVKSAIDSIKWWDCDILYYQFKANSMETELVLSQSLYEKEMWIEINTRVKQDSEALEIFYVVDHCSISQSE